MRERDLARFRDRAAADEARLIAVLRERAAGNPLFISELLRACEESGTLRRPNGEGQQRAWSVGDLTQIPLPPLLKQVLDGSVALLALGGALFAAAESRKRG